MSETIASTEFTGFKSRPYWIMVITLVVADLWTKSWAFATLDEREIHWVAGSWLGFQRLLNPGGVFGIAQGATTILTVIRIFAVGLLIWLAARQLRSNRRGVFTIGLLTAGAVGNLYDNLGAVTGWADGSGHVRDFVRFDLGPAPSWIPEKIWLFDPWPIFNFADSCITVGFVLLLTGLGRVDWPNRAEASTEREAKPKGEQS
jgi:signal peptidase II